MLKGTPKDTIQKVIDVHPEGLTIQKVSDLVGMSRLTATKYIHELIGEGRIYERRIGAARVLYSKERFMKLVKEEEIIQKIKEKMK